MRIKVAKEEMKNGLYRIDDKPYFMNSKAFISTNLALSNVNLKKSYAEKSVYLNGPETSALIVAGITYAKKGTLLGQIREKLWEKTKQDGKPALWYLPKDFGEFLSKQGIDVGKKPEELLRESLKVLKSYEKTPDRVEELSEKMEVPELLFFTAALALSDNPYDEKVQEYYYSQIKSYVDYKKKVSGEMNSDDLAKVYENAYSTVAWRINRKAYLISEMVKGKGLADLVVPDDYTDRESLFKARENFLSVVEAIEKTYNPDFDYSPESLKELAAKVDEAVKSGKQDVMLGSVLDEILQYPEAKGALLYNLMVATEGLRYPITVHSFKKELEEKGITEPEEIMTYAGIKAYLEYAKKFGPKEGKEVFLENLEETGIFDVDNREEFLEALYKADELLKDKELSVNEEKIKEVESELEEIDL